MSLELFLQSNGYEIEGRWMPRVTTITSIISKPNLARYYAQHPNLLAAQRALALAADWGTIIHEAAESVLKGESFVMDARIAPSIQKFREWLGQHDIQVLNPQEDIERRVFDTQNNYAGTIDIFAQVNGKRGIIDIKTGSGIWDEYYLQTAAYLNAYNKNVERKRRGTTRWILRIDQYQRCEGCLAKLRTKDGTVRIRGGKRFCNHQWCAPTAEIQFKELPNYERDLEAFFAAKDVWEWYNRNWLKKIPNYPHNLHATIS